jgi:hypothetical protein
MSIDANVVEGLVQSVMTHTTGPDVGFACLILAAKHIYDHSYHKPDKGIDHFISEAKLVVDSARPDGETMQ